jgi:carbonic anhydrase
MKTARLSPALLLLAICAGWAAAATASDAPAPKPAKAAAAPPAAVPVAAEAAAPAADPMDQLRRRLAERLQNQKSGSAVSPASTQQDLRVVAKPAKASVAAPVAAEPKAGHAAQAPTAVKAPLAAAAHASPAAQTVAPAQSVVPVAAHLVSPPVHGVAPAGALPHVAALPAAPAAPVAHAAPAAPPARARLAAKTAASHGSEAHWDYTGSAGPQTWGGLKPEFSLCSVGQRQSPIDIRGGLSVDLEPVRFDYQSSRFSVIDNGHTVQANLAPGNAIEIGGNRFELQQFHFHRPSEERIDGRQFEMSVHLVHKDTMGKLAVVTLLLEKGPAQPAVQKVWNNLPLEKNQDVPARVALDLNELLPTDQRYYTYMGSLTTPPCTEGVQWVVMRQPVTVAPEQIELFARIYPMNARPVQQAAGRRIMQSN